jgi:hypothetical protein
MSWRQIANEIKRAWEHERTTNVDLSSVITMMGLSYRPGHGVLSGVSGLRAARGVVGRTGVRGPRSCFLFIEKACGRVHLDWGTEHVVPLKMSH